MSPLVSKLEAYDALASLLAQHAVGDESPLDTLRRVLAEPRPASAAERVLCEEVRLLRGERDAALSRCGELVLQVERLQDQASTVREELEESAGHMAVLEDQARLWREAYASLQAEVRGLAERPVLTVLEGGAAAEGQVSHG